MEAERWALIDQRILQHIERAREPVLQGTREVLGQFRDELKEFKRALEEKERAFDARLAELEARLKSVPGKLPVVKTWQPETVVYQAELVSHGGSLFQARKDTGQEPGRGADWVCVARRGTDGKSPTFRGKFDTHERYEGFDIVTVDGCAFICRPRQSGRVSRHGLGSFDAGGKDRHPRRARRTGSARLEGHQGDKGNDAAEIVSWCVDDAAYRVIGFRSDGKPVKELNLRPMFERFLAEAGVALVEQVKAELRQNPW